jgi:hypothetical protein
LNTSQTNTIWIVPIEPIDQRYTKQWYDNLPGIIDKATDKFAVKTIDGGISSVSTTAGAFLDFSWTNRYKAQQVSRIAEMFHYDGIKAGDRFLFTDAWHFGIIPIKYMSELLNIPVEVHGIWHAGSYDPTDILGKTLDINWSYDFEISLFQALDFSYYATDFHREMFLENLDIKLEHNKAIRSGQPHNHIIKPLVEKRNRAKEDIIMFPHRLNDDKQPEIAFDLQTKLPYEFCITQQLNLSKDDYYERLGAAKVVFSCALHENLGISVMEGCLAGAIPIVPDRASYSEMYLDVFKYPSEWTSSLTNYMKYRDYLIAFITDRTEHYDKYYGYLMLQYNILIDKYCTPTVMIDNLTR